MSFERRFFKAKIIATIKLPVQQKNRIISLDLNTGAPQRKYKKTVDNLNTAQKLENINKPSQIKPKTPTKNF